MNAVSRGNTRQVEDDEVQVQLISRLSSRLMKEKEESATNREGDDGQRKVHRGSSVSEGASTRTQGCKTPSTPLVARHNHLSL